MAENKPLVTVLLSVYNSEEFLSEAIESIINQKYENLECLFIDDGSTDGSKEILLSYDDSRIKVIENKNNIGLAASLNKGIDLAKGKYIARMDADDISLPDRIAKQVDALEQDDSLALCGTWAYRIDEKGSTTEEIKVASDYGCIYFKLLLINQFIHGTVTFRAEILKNYRYDATIKLAQDYDLWLRILLDGHKMINIPSFLYLHRFHDSGISQTSLIDQDLQAAKTLKKVLDNQFNYKIDITTALLLKQTSSGQAIQPRLFDYYRIRRLLNHLTVVTLNATGSDQIIWKKIISMRGDLLHSIYSSMNAFSRMMIKLINSAYSTSSNNLNEKRF